MDPAYRSLLWYILAGTRGGPSRIRILELLRTNPHNAHQLALTLDMDYRTTRHHLRVLVRNGLVVCPVGQRYGAPYELVPLLAAHFEWVSGVREGVLAAQKERAAGRTALRGHLST
jgi:DNA-binding transcriptional ArsR family regulator